VGGEQTQNRQREQGVYPLLGGKKDFIPKRKKERGEAWGGRIGNAVSAFISAKRGE